MKRTLLLMLMVLPVLNPVSAKASTATQGQEQAYNLCKDPQWPGVQTALKNRLQTLNERRSLMKKEIENLHNRCKGCVLSDVRKLQAMDWRSPQVLLGLTTTSDFVRANKNQLEAVFDFFDIYGDPTGKKSPRQPAVERPLDKTDGSDVPIYFDQYFSSFEAIRKGLVESEIKALSHWIPEERNFNNMKYVRASIGFANTKSDLLESEFKEVSALSKKLAARCK